MYDARFEGNDVALALQRVHHARGVLCLQHLTLELSGHNFDQHQLHARRFSHGAVTQNKCFEAFTEGTNAEEHEAGWYDEYHLRDSME